jgi:hypothetical protein
VKRNRKGEPDSTAADPHRSGSKCFPHISLKFPVSGGAKTKSMGVFLNPETFRYFSFTNCEFHLRIMGTRAGLMDKGLEEGLSRIDKGQGGAQEAPTGSFFVGWGPIGKSLRKHASYISLTSGARSRVEHRGATSQAQSPWP